MAHGGVRISKMDFHRNRNLNNLLIDGTKELETYESGQEIDMETQFRGNTDQTQSQACMLKNQDATCDCEQLHIEESDESDGEQVDAREYPSLSTAFMALGGLGILVTKTIQEDDDLEGGGIFQHFHTEAPVQPSEGGGQAAQAPSPSRPTQSEILQQMACQAASNAAGSVGAGAAAAAGTTLGGGMGPITMYVQQLHQGSIFSRSTSSDPCYPCK